jgi:hypothetical protein
MQSNKTVRAYEGPFNRFLMREEHVNMFQLYFLLM